MRVALLLSGQMRTFDQPDVLKQYHDLLINPLNVDIFVSTWSNRGCSHNHGEPINTTMQDESVTAKAIETAYNGRLVSVDIENISDFEAHMPDSLRDIYKNGFVWSGITVKGTSVPQLYKIKRANQLKIDYEKAGGFKYDLVIRSRPDNIMVAPFDTRHLALDKNIYAINCLGTFYPNRIYDIFFYGSSENMDLISSAYDNMVEIERLPFHNGLHPRDACRILYVQALISGLNVLDLNYNPCFIKR